MKNIFFAISLLFIGIVIKAQNNFEKNIQKSKAIIEKSNSISELDAVFVKLESLTRSTDKNKWKAYYYAGLAQYKKAELLIKEKKTEEALNSNALAYKYISGGVPANEVSGKKLLSLIALQKKKL